MVAHASSSMLEVARAEDNDDGAISDLEIEPKLDGDKTRPQSSGVVKRANVSFDFGKHHFHLPVVYEDSPCSDGDKGRSTDKDETRKVEEELPVADDYWRAVLVSLHGSPGSHRDWKYVRPLVERQRLRLVALNFPGYGHTPNDPRLRQKNAERLTYVSSFIKQIILPTLLPNQPLLLLGHSRGAECALKASVELQKECPQLAGCVLVNGTGVRPHRAYRPPAFLNALAWLDRRLPLPLTSVCLRPFFYLAMTRLLRFRIRDGAEAAHCVQAAGTFALREHGDWARKAAKTPLRILALASGRDRIIEASVSEEFFDVLDAKTLRHPHHRDTPEAQEACDQVREEFELHGTRRVAVMLELENHFTQKHRADVIAAGADMIVSLRTRELKQSANKSS